MRDTLSILFLAKNKEPHSGLALAFLQQHIKNLTFCIGSRGTVFPEEARKWQGDLIISYLSPWIIEEEILNRAKLAAINFHPGTPDYPGIGCTNFALYEGSPQFGVTCHHMASKVDTGKVIAVKTFPIYDSDSVLSLTQRCYAHISSLFLDMMDIILNGEELPVSPYQWSRRPFTRRELNELCRITEDMSKDEVQRRVRAVSFPGAPGAFVEVDGKRVPYSSEK